MRPSPGCQLHISESRALYGTDWCQVSKRTESLQIVKQTHDMLPLSAYASWKSSQRTPTNKGLAGAASGRYTCATMRSRACKRVRKADEIEGKTRNAVLKNANERVVAAAHMPRVGDLPFRKHLQPQGSSTRRKCCPQPQKGGSLEAREID